MIRRSEGHGTEKIYNFRQRLENYFRGAAFFNEVQSKSVFGKAEKAGLLCKRKKGKRGAQTGGSLTKPKKSFIIQKRTLFKRARGGEMRGMIKIRHYLKPNAVRMAFGLLIKAIGTVAELLLPLLLGYMLDDSETSVVKDTKTLLLFGGLE